MIDDDWGSWRTLDDLEDELRRRLEARHPGDILRIRLRTTSAGIEISGEVASEAARADAGRQLASFKGIPRVLNRLEVTGFLHPSADDDEIHLFSTRRPVTRRRHTTGQGSKASGSSGTTSTAGSVTSAGAGAAVPPTPALVAVQRHPAISTPDQLAAGKRIRISVDLTATPRVPAAPSLHIADLEPGWKQLDVEVSLTSAVLLHLDPQRAYVRIMEDGSSVAAELAATVAPHVGVGEEVTLTGIFSYKGRFCGTWGTSLGAVSPVADPRGGQEDEAPAALVTIAPSARSPDLTVVILPAAPGSLLWSWTTHVDLGPGAGASHGRADVGDDAQEFARSLLLACPEMGKDEFRRRMRSIGEQIWQRTPSEFRATYAALGQRLGPAFAIQFIVDEHHIPWEMMRPEISGLEIDHLFLEHPVARWPSAAGNALLQNLPKGRIVSFVPEYDANGTLPAAREEGAWLRTHLGATAAKPCKQDFLSLMEGPAGSPAVGLVHFAGHGSASNAGKRNAGLRFEDGWVLLDDVNNGGTKLGTRDRSMVVLNACEAGTGEAQLGWSVSWASMLAARGFGAVVAPLWRIQDGAARDLVTAGLESLVLNGSSLGEAFSKARADVSRRSVAAFAFLAYGDVMARPPAR